MKNKLEIFSNDKLKNFFTNFSHYFEIVLRNYNELEKFKNQKNTSLVFLENHNTIAEQTFKKLNENKNFIFLCRDFAVFQKLSIIQENILICPIGITKLIDTINNLINAKEHIFENVHISNQIITNIKNKEYTYLTQAEIEILTMLFNETKIKKKTLDREVLQIKEELNTSSMESHLNRIRKKLKKIQSDFTISSKDNFVYLEALNLDT